MYQQKIDTIIFDLDGTLMNSIDDLTENMNRVLEEEGYPVKTVAEAKLLVGNGILTLMERALPVGTNHEEVLRCLEIFKGYYLEPTHTASKPYEGILELLEALKNRSIKTGVVSNKPDEATKKMCDQYFPGLIDIAIGDNVHRKKKPWADNVWEAMRLLNATRETTVYVGDTKVDVETAKNAQLPILGVSWGYRGAKELQEAGSDFIVDSPLEIIKWLDHEKAFTI